MLNILEFICLKCQNLKKLQNGGKKKNQNWWKPRELLASCKSLYPIIDNIFLSYNLVEHYFSPLFFPFFFAEKNSK
jgi:hypothetical protein